MISIPEVLARSAKLANAGDLVGLQNYANQLQASPTTAYLAALVRGHMESAMMKQSPKT